MNRHEKELFLEALHTFGTCDVRVYGMSMWPFIRDKDMITVRHTVFTPSLGAVVAFFNDTQLIVHRVLWYRKKRERGWLIWIAGDSSLFSCSKIDSALVCGSVLKIAGNHPIRNFFLGFPARIVVIALGFLLRAAMIIRRVMKECWKRCRCPGAAT
ncbi:MAG: S24/S26 family peptidase [Chitinivibrionales bacterium]|nr:S24/S26 family peptidase [Chitinivibrionales bacterium]